MNIIGHNFIAKKVIGEINNLTFIGSHIPDFVPFLPSSVFSFDEIHEGGDGLLQFVQANYPNSKDLPLAMMAHSVKYGADGYNKSIDEWLLDSDEESAREISLKIVETSGIDYETAREKRLHNYLWAGADIYLMNKNPEGITDQLKNISGSLDFGLTAEILSKHFNKDQDLVLRNLEDHFKIVSKSAFESVEGFAEYNKKFMSVLPEGDNIKIDRTVEALDFIYNRFESKWKNVLLKVVNMVSSKMPEQIIPNRKFL